MSPYDLPFSGTVLNAAGTLGYNPAPRGLDLAGLDAFVTNPVSLAPRTAAAGTRFLRYPGGALLHTGLPNPGFREVLKENAKRWARSPRPVIVHLIAGSPDELYRMVRRLEETEGVAGIEVGIDSGSGVEFAEGLVQAAVGELPVIARLGLEDFASQASRILEAGASAVSMGPPRGRLPDVSGKPISGRLAGGAVFPLALEALRQAGDHGPLIFSGGILEMRQVEQALAAGAAAVQLDTLLWRQGALSAPAGSSSGRR